MIYSLGAELFKEMKLVIEPLLSLETAALFLSLSFKIFTLQPSTVVYNTAAAYL